MRDLAVSSYGAGLRSLGAPGRPSVPLLVALAGLAFVTWQAGAVRPRLAVAALIGAGAGFALYHASFGFTAAWRRIVTERRGLGIRAQMALLMATCLVSYPLLAYGLPVEGWRVGGFVMPFGVAAAFGAFVFGIGMQLGGGCASGTLFTVGGGSTRMAVTLFFFIVGSVWATAHLPWWNTLPRLAPVSLVRELGAAGALAVLFTFAGSVWWWSQTRERAAHGELEQARPTASLLRGPWSPWLGAVALALVGVATLVTLGRPWGITSAFALWGAKGAMFLGIDVASWPYWSGQTARLERTVFADGTSVMNLAIVAGAMTAAALAGRYAPVWRIGWVPLATAVAGGLMMGYGARLAYGCNIGAYLGGIVSGSLHGWAWAVFAFAGSSLTSVLRQGRF